MAFFWAVDLNDHKQQTLNLNNKPCSFLERVLYFSFHVFSTYIYIFLVGFSFLRFYC